MCIEALVITDSGEHHYCEMLGQLYELVGKTLQPEERHDDCLCNVDWTLIGGRRATEAEGFPFPAYIIDQSANLIRSP